VRLRFLVAKRQRQNPRDAAGALSHSVICIHGRCKLFVVVTWHIEKTGEDSYSLTIADVNGSQLIGMLNAKGLAGKRIDEILQLLDSKDIGYQTTVTFLGT
jgi:hypothetical protein